MTRILGVDVDLTVVSTDQGWIDWLVDEARKEGKLGYSIYGNNRHYDFTKYFPFLDNARDYWKNLDYFQFQPLEQSREKLEALSKYFKIVFISAEHCGYLSKNKKEWLKEHFPFMEGYMCTKEKYLMNNSVTAMIDDRVDVLSKFDYNKRVLFSSPYEQSSNEPVAMRINNWNDFNVKEFCERYL